MAQRETFPHTADGAIGRQHDAPGDCSRPNPEQGHRLMRTFLSIREAALREAIVKFVNELSTLQDENR